MFIVLDVSLSQTEQLLSQRFAMLIPEFGAWVRCSLSVKECLAWNNKFGPLDNSDYIN